MAGGAGVAPPKRRRASGESTLAQAAVFTFVALTPTPEDVLSLVMSVYTEMVNEALVELSDANYQRRVWTGGGAANEMSSFDECVDRLFGDSGLDFALERGEPVYGSRLDDELRRLGDLVRRIDGSRSPDDVLRDPLLEPVRQLASEILLALDQRGRSGVI